MQPLSFYNTPLMINRNFFSSEKSRVIVSDRFIPVRNPEDSQHETLQLLLEARRGNSPSPASRKSRSSRADPSCVHSVEQTSVSDLLIRDYLEKSGQKLFTFSRTPKQQRMSSLYRPGLSGKAWMPSSLDSSCQCFKFGATARKFGCGEYCSLRRRPESRINARDLPLKILDAPGMTDDFYLDVLDWGQDGSIALGIEDKVFIYKFPEGTTRELVDLEKINRQWVREEAIQEEDEEDPLEQSRKSLSLREQSLDIEEELLVPEAQPQIPEFFLNTPVKDKDQPEKLPTKDCSSKGQSPKDVLYLSFDDSDLSQESESDQMSPLGLPQPSENNRITFKVENFNEGFATPKKGKGRTVSIFEQQRRISRLDSLDALNQLNFDELADVQNERVMKVKKRLFADEDQPSHQEKRKEIPDFNLDFDEESETNGEQESPHSDSEDSDFGSSFSLSIQEEKSESKSIVSEESEFEEEFQLNNPFLRVQSQGLNTLAQLESPPQLRSPEPGSPNNFLLDQVNMIVNQNFLESPENPVPPVQSNEEVPSQPENPLQVPRFSNAIPRVSQMQAPRLSTRESLIQGKNQVISCKFNQSGKLLSVVDACGFVYVIQLNTGCLLYKHYFPHKISAICWNGDKILAIGDSNGRLFLFSLDRGFDNPLLNIQMHDSEIIKITFSQNGSYLATSGADKRILGLDLGRLRHHFYSLRGSFLQNLPELEMISESDVISLTTLPSMSKALIFHPQNPRYLIIGGGVDDQKIRIFDIISKRLLLRVNAGSQVCSLGFDSEGKTLISSHGFSENVIKLWELNVLMKRLTEVKVLSGHAERVLHFSISPCGKFIVSGSGDETLRIWECFDNLAKAGKPRSTKGNFMKRGISSMR